MPGTGLHSRGLVERAGRTAAAIRALAPAAITESETDDIIDFDEPVTLRRLAQLAERNREHSARFRLHENPEKLSPQQQVRLLTDEYRNALEEIGKRFKVPFIFEQPAIVGG